MFKEVKEESKILIGNTGKQQKKKGEQCKIGKEDLFLKRQKYWRKKQSEML